MGGHRTAWHLLAAAFIDERRPRSVTLESNFELTREPQRADLLLIRKIDGPVDDARAFYRLWALMGPVAIVEYKSPSRPARSGVMSQLLGYGHQYTRGRRDELGGAHNLSLFLMVHDITPTVRDDIAWLGHHLEASEGAYTRVVGPTFPTWIVALDPLAKEEREPLIGRLGSRTLDQEDTASHQWLAHFVMANQEHAKNLEGFEELKAQFLDSELFKKMVAEMPAAKFAEVLTAAARSLPPEQQFAVLLAMSDDALRTLPDSFVEALPEAVRTEIRRRLAH